MNVWLFISIAAKHSETAALKDLTLTVKVASGLVSCLLIVCTGPKTGQAVCAHLEDTVTITSRSHSQKPYLCVYA